MGTSGFYSKIIDKVLNRQLAMVFPLITKDDFLFSNDKRNKRGKK